jgi:hypothetical protein
MTGLTHPQCLGEKGATRSGVLPPFKLYISSSLPKFNTWTTGGSLSPFPIPRLVDWTVAGEQQMGNTSPRLTCLSLSLHRAISEAQIVYS